MAAGSPTRMLCEIYGVTNIGEFYSDSNSEVTELTGDEKELIRIFRSLNKESKSTLLATARGFAGNPAMQKDGSNTATA